MAGGGALTRRVQFPILCGTTRWLLGEEICDGLNIPRTIWSRILPLTYRPAVQLSEALAALMQEDRTRAVARSIHRLATGNAAVGVMPNSRLPDRSAHPRSIESQDPIAPPQESPPAAPADETQDRAKRSNPRQAAFGRWDYISCAEVVPGGLP
jgi:hypothetical protein